MGFSFETGVSVFTVFIQGLLGFFSPCVLPLLPVYITYLAGSGAVTQEDGTVIYPRKRTLLHTFCFTLGICAAFFLLALGFTALGAFLGSHRVWFTRICGIIMILFGLYQLGVFGQFRFLASERRLPFSLDKATVNPITAWIFGFTFSFAWTPCIGPALSSVLLMVSASGSMVSGLLLIGVYSAGFIIPFLGTGLFTGAVLNFFKKHRKIVAYTVKISGVLLIIMGIVTIAGFMNGMTSYLASVSQPVSAGSSGQSAQNPAVENTAGTGTGNEPTAIPAPDFTLTDQYGNTHTLSAYKGKTVFLNFWATWCPPCRAEMPDIQALYESYGSNTGDLIVLGVANPKSAENPYGQDGTKEEVMSFLKENNFTFPVVMDMDGMVFARYGISAFPTTFMITSDSTVFGYVPGALPAEIMESIVQQTMTGIRR